MSKRRPTVPFADIVRDVKVTPVRIKELRPGHYGDVFVDEGGEIYELAADDVDSTTALRLATNGAGVVWDACGCGGWCGRRQRFTDEEVQRMALSGPPTIRRTKRHHGRIDHLRASDGSSFLMVEGAVGWGDVLG